MNELVCGSLPNNISKFNLKEACHAFSEGDFLLEQALYNLNIIGFRTYSCCSGHIYNNFNGYITFYLNFTYLDKSLSIIQKLLDLGLFIELFFNEKKPKIILRFNSENKEAVLNSIINLDKENNLPPTLETYKILKKIVKLYSKMPFYNIKFYKSGRILYNINNKNTFFNRKLIEIVDSNELLKCLEDVSKIKSKSI